LNRFDSRQGQDILIVPAALSPGVENWIYSTDYFPKPSAPFIISGAKVTPPPYAFISCTASDAV
jgi:hypothetical protein